MPRLRVRINVEEPALMMWKSPHYKQKMVYVVRVNRIIRTHRNGERFKNRGSRIVYIGMTTKGASRPSGSMSRIAEKAFAELRGVKTVKVFILNSSKRKNVKTWEQLESALLGSFKESYGAYPHFNRKGGMKLSNRSYYRTNRLASIINELS